MSTVIPICVLDTFKPVSARLIEGETELLLGLDIIRELDITVEFGSDHFRIGQVELEMMTYNGKHHWVFPLLPTDCAYAALGEYFGKLQKSQISALQAHGDFGCHLEVRKVTKSKSRRLESKMEIQNDNFGYGRYTSKYFCATSKCPFRKRNGQNTSGGIEGDCEIVTSGGGSRNYAK